MEYIFQGFENIFELVYCPFPGFIEHGKILLIGNMGLYEYRPYVRKIQNGRQIMFQCDRGYSMIEPGPSGATCIAGEWSPPQLPRYFSNNFIVDFSKVNNLFQLRGGFSPKRATASFSSRKQSCW